MLTFELHAHGPCIFFFSPPIPLSFPGFIEKGTGKIKERKTPPRAKLLFCFSLLRITCFSSGSMSTPVALDSKNVIGGNVKQAKFDRQLRLWGSDGQAALEAAHVVALGATPVIAQALKSLVLTGVSTVTLVDERVATSDDAATNYFVSATSVGTSLATAVLQNVCALNETCVGVAAVTTAESWADAYVAAVDQDWRAGCLRHNATSGTETGNLSACGTPRAGEEKVAEDVSAVQRLMTAYPAVAGVNVTAPPAVAAAAATTSAAPPSLILVSERYAELHSASSLVRTCLTKCYPDVPVMLVRSSGLLGLLQVYCPPRVILRPHNPTQVKMEDLRIFEPFPALQAWFKTHNPDDDAQFSSGDAEAMSLHSHLPYPCILHFAFHRWWASLSQEEKVARRQPTSGGPSASTTIFPLAAKDYHAMANVVAGMIRRQSPPEDAFVEAMEKCTAKLNRPVVQQLPEGLAALLHNPRCADPQLAVEELKRRLGPASRSPSAVLLWTSPEVLVWFILHAVQLFLKGEIGREASTERGGAMDAATLTTELHRSHDGGCDAGGEKEAPAPSTANPLPSRFSSYHFPHSGYLPDFTTTTLWYRELQHIYNAKHLEDVACIAEKAWELVARAAFANSAQAQGDGDAAEGATDASVVATSRLEQHLARAVQPLLTKYTTAVVENIWDLRGVSFSEDYAAAHASEWRQRLARRMAWIACNITHDVEWNANARRAACLAVAYLCKEELQRCVADAPTGEAGKKNQHRITGQDIADEALRLAALVHTSDEQDRDAESPAEDGSAAWWTKDAASRDLFSKACEEVARWAGDAGAAVQLPSVAASTGALAAQEAAKLIMRIRVPCGQPIMYDGYTNRVYTL